MNEFDRAYSRISEIHDHLARSEVYRGFRSLPIALSGVMALVAAALQDSILGPDPVLSFIWYWTAVAALNMLFTGGGILYNYINNESIADRKRTQRVIGQFLPCMAVGVIITAAAIGIKQFPLDFLPGVWAVIFSLGVFASRPYLPRIIGWVGMFYLVAGTYLMVMANGFSPWGMGIVFGLGQSMSAFVLYWNLERKQNGQ
jgi:hypothetical protein